MNSNKSSLGKTTAAIFIGTSILLFIIFYFEIKSEKQKSQAESEKAEHIHQALLLMQEAFKNDVKERFFSIDQRDKNNLNIEFDEISDNKITMIVEFNKPQEPSYAAMSAKVMVMSVLKSLINNGHKPSAEHIFIGVSVLAHVTGITGTDKAVSYGIASYDPYSDSISFQYDEN